MTSSIEARYMGYHGNDGYWVNVRIVQPREDNNDGGLIKRFETEESALAYAKGVNDSSALSKDVYVHEANTDKIDDKYVNGDSFVSGNNDIQPPRISWARATFGLLRDDQVEAINLSRKVPKNVKIMMNGAGGYTLGYNYFGVRSGTQTLPQGFEVKKDWLGFTIIVPKDTDGMFIG